MSTCARCGRINPGLKGGNLRRPLPTLPKCPDQEGDGEYAKGYTNSCANSDRRRAGIARRCSIGRSIPNGCILGASRSRNIRLRCVGKECSAENDIGVFDGKGLPSVGTCNIAATCNWDSAAIVGDIVDKGEEGYGNSTSWVISFYIS